MMLVLALLELCIISLAIAATSKSPISTRFGLAFHGFFCSLALMAQNPMYPAMTSLFVGAIIAPLLVSKTFNHNRCGLSSRITACIIAFSALAPAGSAMMGLGILPVQIGIQIMLSLLALKSFSVGLNNVVAFSGFGQTSTVLLAVLEMLTSPTLVLAEIAILALCVMACRRSGSQII